MASNTVTKRYTQPPEAEFGIIVPKIHRVQTNILNCAVQPMKLDWKAVANAAGNCSPEIAEAVIYMIFQFAAHFVSEGNHVSIEMQLGRLLIRPGNI